MQQKDYVVTLSILGRTVHQIIVRAVNERTAEIIARSVAVSMEQLNDREIDSLEYFTELFNHLDSHEFFVCF
jgi:hypothetical protein